MDNRLIKLGAQIELARREFFFYCQLKAPDFYKENRTYLVKLCKEFQEFYQSKDKIMILNLPPRHGKSRTAGLFVEWVLGKNQNEKIMTGSYNEMLSSMFSKNVRNDIQEKKADQYKPVFRDVFPTVKIKQGDGAMNLWSLEGSYNNYLATSPTGTATGFGATCFPKGTIVYSNRGKLDVSEIYNDKNCILILSYDHQNDALRYNKVIAKRRLVSDEFIEITTNTGRKIKSTTDHRYYTNEYGYLQARELKRGYTVKIAELHGNMSSLWKKRKSFNVLAKVPYKIAQDEKIISIHSVSKEDYVYDLQIERDHNFFANGVLVHNCLIIDDLIKNAEEANNEIVKEKHWEWFTNTMLSRLEEGGKIIIIMTRWASDDLAGRVLEHYKGQGVKVRHICMKALLKNDTHEMLCSEVLSYNSYQSKIKAMGENIASANYQQEPIDLKGRLYGTFKTYKNVIPQFKEIRNYTDTADTGEDYLCSINYGVTFSNEAYILDVLYTKEPMEITEFATAKLLYDGHVNIADIESNNGGRGFARNVERILNQQMGSNKTIIRWFSQNKNKQARIYSNSAWITQHIYFPEDWRNRFPEYYKAMFKYQKEGRNKHDDAPDATTGIAEKMGVENNFSFE